MSQASERLAAVLIAPHLSEKSTRSAEAHRQFVFRVRRDSDKSEIKRAVESMFDVTVTGVRIVNIHGKRKRFGNARGRRQDWKKAYVTLAEGQDLDFIGAE